MTWCLRGNGGFTLIEIVVAIGILVMVVGFAGVVFQRSIGSYRTAMAQAEIMRKLRVITEQLDSDFRGLRKDAPMYMWFQYDSNSFNNRFDQIMFFADGDFQSVSTYNGKTVVGNVARIYYGNAQNTSGVWAVKPAKNRILARRQHILTADDTLPLWRDFSNFTIANNETYEYDNNSLSQWQAYANEVPANADNIINVCFNYRPLINPADASTFHNLMTEGIGSFSIQWDYITGPSATPAGAHFWWPALDPDGNGDMSDSDFDGTKGMKQNPFGIYFNSASPFSSIWFSPAQAMGSYYPDNSPLQPRPAYPKALKFVFTIYDSRGVFPQGQTFSHIVYIGD